MANDINRVILIGRLTRDPELKSTNAGKYFCLFTLASNRNIYNKETGESRDEVGFFDCVIWGKPAEAVHKYVAKGRRLCVEGHLRWTQWEGTDGKKQSKVSVAVESFQFLEPKANQAGGEAPGESSAGTMDSAAMADDDIPF